ncbi:bile salt sulfotransferase-like isoform X2 [Octodon degus]|uniref:Sulfotransferase n=1 Tax=Octodon degus TaxID=10160 RepID=A0A6P6DX74_OCTDE|nr:bile salt sulfotransferase-like isoform X2 [Octodon degus]
MLDNFVWFEGIPFPSFDICYETIKDVRDNFVINDDDVFTVGYPKSGNNWVVEIICLIISKGNPKWSQSVPIWDRSPWIETDYGHKLISEAERPLLSSSHLPFQLFPKSFFSSKAKVIYIMRNPRDILVSGFHFWNSFKSNSDVTSLEQYSERFLQGNVPWGSWFEHVRGWLSMRGRENFLVLTYEEMQKESLGIGRLTSL